MEEEGNVRAIRNFMIKSLNRYMMDMEFMKNVVKQNNHAFETEKDILEQFDRVNRELQAIIDYNFYEVEIKAVMEKELE